MRPQARRSDESERARARFCASGASAACERAAKMAYAIPGCQGVICELPVIVLALKQT